MAQSLSLFEIDPSDFPRIRGKFIAVDADGHSYRPDPTDLHLFEGETARNITLLDCPPPTPLEPISAVLVLDVSSSMLVSDGRNLEIARSAARAWIDGMALGLSECAVTSFEERSFLVQDFTIDSRRLHDAVDQLVPFGGTGYNAAFLSPVTGAIPVATRGKHRRIIIFLTDGRGSGNEEEIVRQATAANATIHCVTVGLPAPDILKNVATRTGGRWFENVETPEEAAAIYRTLLLQAQGGEPCRIEWTSAPSCDPVRDVRLEERRLGTEALARYIVPAAGITNLTIADDELRFGVVAAGNAATMATAITASGGPVRILSVTSSHPRFTITSGQAPPDYTVASGNSQQIAIRYDAENTDYTVAKITIETEGCDRVIYAAAGRWGGADDPQGGEPPPIRLVFPNGGERFAVGSTTAMTWTGVLPTDTVRLDYSTDAGQTWLPVAEKATGLRQPWLVPNTPSFTCLARVSIDGVGGNSDTGAPFARVLHTYRGHDDRVFGGPLARARFSPDGSHVASASTKLTDQLRVWKSLDGAFFDDRTPAARIRDIDWSADGTKVAMATDEGGGQVTVGSFTTTDRVSFPARDVTTVALRQDIPGMIATGHRNGEVRLWNDDGSLDRTIGAGELGLGEISALAYRPNNADLLIAGRGTNGDADTMKIYTTDGRFQALFPRNAGVTTHTAGISSARFSPDGSQIISVGFDGIASLWDRLGGRPQRELRGHNDGAISPDGRLVVIGNGDTIWTSGNRPSTPLIYDAQTGVELDRLDGEHTGAVTSVDITQIGEVYYVVTASLDSTVVVWEIAPRGSGGGTGPGVDESDDLWAIVAAGITTNEVDFGRRNVGSTTDSVVTALIRNVGDIAVDVDSLAIIGPDATSFSVVSGDAPFTCASNKGTACSSRWSLNPSTKGASGPTTTNSTFISLQKSETALWFSTLS